MRSRGLSRRRFLRRAAGVLAGGIAASAFVSSRVLGLEGKTAPSDAITRGVIGAGGPCAALQGLRTLGGAAEVPKVVARLSSSHAAVRSLAGMPGGDVTSAVEEAARATQGEAKAALERALEERRRPRGREF